MCTGPLRGYVVCQTLFCVTQTDEILTYFHSHVLWVLLFPALVFQAGKPGVGLGSLTVQSQDISLNS